MKLNASTFLSAFLCTALLYPLAILESMATEDSTAEKPNVTPKPTPDPVPECDKCKENESGGSSSSTSGCDGGKSNSIHFSIGLGTTTYTGDNNFIAQDLRQRVAPFKGYNSPTTDKPPFAGSLSLEWGSKLVRPVVIGLVTDTITEASFTPAGLQLYGDNAGSAWVKKDANGALRQILTDQYLTDITTPDGIVLVSTYLRSTIGAQSGGLYTIPVTAKLHRRVQISRPDPLALDKVEILTRDFSSSQTMPKRRAASWHVDGVGNNVTWTFTQYAVSPEDVTSNDPGEIPLVESWTLNEANKFSEDVLIKDDSLGNGVIRNRRTVRNYGITTSVTHEKYRNLGNDTLRIVERVEAPDTPEELTTTFTYTDLTGTGTVGLEGAIAEPTPGSSFNRLIGARLHSMQRSDGYWEQYSYQYNAGTQIMHTEIWSPWKNSAFGDKANSRYQSITLEEGSRTVIKKIAGQLVANEHETLTIAADGTRTLRSERKTGTNSAPLITEQAYFSDTAAEPNKGRIKYSRQNNGTFTRYTYATVSGNLRTTTETGSADQDQFAISATGPVPAPTDGTRTVKLTNTFEHVIDSKTYDIASGLLLDQFLVASVDAVGRPTHIIHDGDPDDFEIFTYACCGVKTHRTRDGSLTEYSKDALERPTLTTVTLGSKTTSTGYSYTSETIGGRDLPKTTVTQSITAGSETTGSLLISESVSNLRGQTLKSLSPDANNDDEPDETTYVYDDENRTRSAIGPDGITQTSTSYADGQTNTSVSTFDNIPVTPLTTYDYTPHNINGGGIKTSVTTSGEGLAAFAQHSYSNLAGRTFRTESPGHNGATLVSTTTFDERGRAIGQSTTGQPATLRVLNLRGEVIESWTDSNGDGEFNNTVVGGIKDSYSKSLSDFVTEDSNISQRTRQWIRDDADDDILVSTTFRSPDGLYQKSVPLSGPVSVSTASKPLNGSATSETKTYLTGSTFLTRLSTTTLNANGTTTATSVDKDTTGATITTASQTADLQGRTVSSTGERGLTTSFDLFTEAGQPLKTIHSDGTYTIVTLDSAARPVTQQTYKADDTLIATVNTSYHANGQPAANWGTNTNPTFSLYDLEGRLIERRTFRSSDLTLAPTAGTANYDKTTWTYESATGLLLAKRDAANKGADYTYTPDGKLSTRTWARGIVTTYAYDTANRLISTDYSDTTPDVTMSYDRLNRQSSVSNGIAKSEFDYNPTTLAVINETISYNLDGQPGFEFSRVLDRSQDTLGRDTGWQLKDGTTVENSATYQYSATEGRLSKVLGLASSSLPSPEFAYGYATGSSLIANVTGPMHTVTNAYEPNRNVLASKQNKVGTEILSKFDYTVNQLGQRESVATSGTAFPAVANWMWGYDALGQVTSANHSTNNDFDRAYQYDTIGNRLQGSAGVSPASVTTYTPNALNQYSSISGGGFQPPGPTYDDDGNQIDAQVLPLGSSSLESCVFSWDAENRLIETTVGTSGPLVRYHYDAQSRLISRSVGVSPTSSTVYIYDAWNRIAEYQKDSSGHTLKRSYLFGMDLSGSMQGAGGVGGLLAVSHHDPQSAIYYPTYDGNGNVSEYLDSIGVIKAHFEYDPFGNTLLTAPLASEDATLKDTFDYRFSTKPVDSITGLLYYGYRWYDPATGRWPSRDPIGEMGGINLYGFVRNDGMNRVDLLGLTADPLPVIGQIVNITAAGGNVSFSRPSSIAEMGKRNASDVSLSNDKCKEKEVTITTPKYSWRGGFNNLMAEFALEMTLVYNGCDIVGATLTYDGGHVSTGWGTSLSLDGAGVDRADSSKGDCGCCESVAVASFKITPILKTLIWGSTSYDDIYIVFDGRGSIIVEGGIGIQKDFSHASTSGKGGVTVQYPPFPKAQLP